MQLPKKKNWSMPRWSITPSWSSANAPHGSSTGIGPVELAAVGVALVHGDHAEVVLELLRDVDHRVSARLLMREFKPPPGVASSGKPEPISA